MSIIRRAVYIMATALALLGASEACSAQTTIVGSCAGADFRCEAVTLFENGSQSVVQFTDNSEGFTHYMTFVGTRDSDELINVTQAERDGKSIGTSGSCDVQQPSQIVCTIGRHKRSQNQIVFQGDK